MDPLQRWIHCLLRCVSRPDETVERPEPRSRDSARPATQREHSIREPVTKRLSRKDDSDVVPKKGVFARLSGGLVKDAAEERGSAAASMERPWRPTVASTVRVARATAPASEVQMPCWLAITRCSKPACLHAAV